MRNFLVYLMLVMFVGAHVVADLSPHFHDDTADIAVAENQLAKNAASLDTIPFLAIASGTDDDCCSKAKELQPSSDIHCIADCGLAAAEFAAYHPNPRYYLAPPNDTSTTIRTINDLFRPPII